MSWEFRVRKHRRSGLHYKPRAPRPDKSLGTWVTRPCRGGVEFYWDPNAVPPAKTTSCPSSGSQPPKSWWKGARAMVVTNSIPAKLCLSDRVICGRKGKRRCPVPGGTVIPCRNAWGCRYQMDLTDLPDSLRRKRLQYAIHAGY